MGGRDLHRNAGERWPLLQKIMADEVYAARYRTLLTQALEGAFEFETFARRAQQLRAGGALRPRAAGRAAAHHAQLPRGVLASCGRARRAARPGPQASGGYPSGVGEIGRRLLADEVRQIAVVLVADVFQQLVVGAQPELLGHRPRP